MSGHQKINALQILFVPTLTVSTKKISIAKLLALNVLSIA